MQEVYYPVDRDWLRQELLDMVPYVTYPDYSWKLENLFTKMVKTTDHASRCDAVIQALHNAVSKHRLSANEMQAIMDGVDPTSKQRLKVRQAVKLERAIAHVLLYRWSEPTAVINQDVYKHLGTMSIVPGRWVSE